MQSTATEAAAAADKGPEGGEDSFDDEGAIGCLRSLVMDGGVRFTGKGLRSNRTLLYSLRRRTSDQCNQARLL